MDAPRPRPQRPERIVSLLPSATEILFAIGAGDQVVGVTFECDFPAEARQRRIVSTSALPEGLSSAEIDAFVAAAVRAGEDLYHLDAGALADIDADLVVTQDLCAVCAVDVSVVDDALAHLGCTAEVVTTDPHTLEEVLETVVLLGEVTGHREEADALVASLRARLAAVVERVSARTTPAPRVLLLEWTDPPYAPGHWVPEMVTLAGGEPVLGRAGEKSVRVTWEDARAGGPDVVVCAPCGFDLDGSAALARDLVDGEELPGHLPVWAVDANASFARPGPRLVDGVEALERVVDVTAGGSAVSEWWGDLGSDTPPLLVRGGGVGGTPEGHPPAGRAVLRAQG
ncbi:MAG: cobalamin-binding protein [Marmoricola sp.]|nr:cobalamin-binding protein [Marmoricola sp.]